MIDLFQLVGDYNSRYLPIIPEGLAQVDGKDYLAISAYNPEQGRASSMVTLWLNMKTRTIDWENQKEKKGTGTAQVAAQDLSKTISGMVKPSSIPDLLHQNQLSFKEGTLKGSLLETADSKLYDILSSSHSQFYFLQDPYLQGDKRSYFALVQLFLPPGTNVYEGVSIPAELSTDGQEHTVSSKEEFEQYYDPAKDAELDKSRYELVDRKS